MPPKISPPTKRGNIRTQLAIFQKYVESIAAAAQVDPKVVEERCLELQTRLDAAIGLYKEFNEVQSTIEEESGVADITERESFSDAYFQHVSRAKQLLASKATVKKCAEEASPVPQQPQVRLPTIPLPSFKGDYESWLEYRDKFESLIHNSSLPNMQKFHYLRASLCGTAAEVIASIECTSNSYLDAWDILCNRFDNSRLLVSNHVKALFNLHVPTRESASSIRKLIDDLSKHLRALETLKQPVASWDTLLIYMITSKLDVSVCREWEQRRDDSPTLKDFKTFLKSRADLLDTYVFNEQQTSNKQKYEQNGKADRKQYNATTRTFLNTASKCDMCKGDHPLFKCEGFLKLNVHERCEKARHLKVCLNCLKRGHYVQDCKSGACRHCSKRHNTLLHITENSRNDEKETEHINDQVSLHTISNSTQALLSTAIIKVKDSGGRFHKARAFLDVGSQSTFITAELHRKLGINKRPASIRVAGFGQAVSCINGSCEVTISSCNGNFKTALNCLITPKITNELPSWQVQASNLKIPSNITLADANFHCPGPIDVLLGADVFWQLLCVGQIQLSKRGLVLQKTRLGWVVGGPISAACDTVKCNLVQSIDVQQQLQQFWEIENLQSTRLYSQEEAMCEEHFQKTTARTKEGRFVVSIPFKGEVSQLGDSRTTAEKRFLQLERKFQNNHSLYTEYKKFMGEYEALGHMRKVVQDNAVVAYYMPHHGVIKEQSETTKLRVVFDASAKTTSGISINDIEMVGPTIQDDLFAILIRFRKHLIVFCADIEKMYRQVLVAEHCYPVQRILWRATPAEPISVYELLTVTYGTAAAAFLAIRSLVQLAAEYASSNPSAAKIIQQDFYVDDLISGADSVDEAISYCTDILHIMKLGCFNLRKWSSNDSRVTDAVASSNSEYITTIGENHNTKTLGLHWDSKADQLFYSISQRSLSTITKRTILSEISQVFDPLGLLAPATIIAKMLLQSLWLEKVGWDETLPLHIHTRWTTYRQQLAALNTLKINRHVLTNDYVGAVQLHGFSDASEGAYGAVIYARSVKVNGEVAVKLLTAKSKVAPVTSLSIPRLELCGALLLAQLMQKTSIALQLPSCDPVFWTDSMIVLGWLKMQPRLLQVFVGNRISQIQQLSNVDDWKHVPTHHNPADLLSRGVFPKDLCDSTLWWNGPEWLQECSSQWPSHVQPASELPELRARADLQVNVATNGDHLLQRFSTFPQARRVIAYCLRFKRNYDETSRIAGPLSVAELQEAERRIIKLVQQDHFKDEFLSLVQGKSAKLPRGFSSLSPFIDDQGIIRVGGRLANSNFSPEKKHPAILPDKHYITKLIFIAEHQRLLHAGPQMLLSSVRDKFWVIGGRNLARKIVHSCTKCFRAAPTAHEPLMGQLPKQRVDPSFPFEIVGVDYAGPFHVKDRQGRGCKVTKAYIALFVCFTTKAVHLELVSSLSTEAFLAALGRFSSRRGQPREVFSDNGRNFVGANNELQEVYKFFASNQSALIEKTANQNIIWHFIPPNSPHFGGLWEAGVKSTKHHLKRVASNANMTFEQMYTLLAEVEAILNSRPMAPLSSDPSDLTALTPSHFLIGRKATSIPSAADYTRIPEGKLSTLQKITQMKQHFWIRWRKEYIAELQQRVKWRSSSKISNVGDLVIVKDDNVPVSAWRLGRIVQLHPGKDGISRVASVRTHASIFKRPITKLCPLPTNA